MKPVPPTNFTDLPVMVLLPDGTLLVLFTVPPEGVDAVTAR
jgi:hypothetical protein